MSTGADAYRPIEPVGAGVRSPQQAQYPRYALTLPGRFMRADKLDHPCRLIDISVESAAMTTPVPLVVGEKLIVYLMHLGGLEGSSCGCSRLLRHDDHRHAAQARQARRADTAAGRAIRNTRRRRARIPPHRRRAGALLVLPDGSTTVCTLQDVSMSGASVLTPARPELGSKVMIDRRARRRAPPRSAVSASSLLIRDSQNVAPSVSA